jgi:hypothetical protein
MERDMKSLQMEVEEERETNQKFGLKFNNFKYVNLGFIFSFRVSSERAREEAEFHYAQDLQELIQSFWI